MNFDEMVQSTETPAPPARRTLELRKRHDVVVGGHPTVSLLPRELRAAARDKSVRRLLVAGVVIALVFAGGCTAGATALSAASQSQLDAANADSQSLFAQLGKFKDVQSLQQQIAVGDAAVKVGGSTEIDWQAQIDAIEQNMPSTYEVSTITADSASAIQDYPQGTTPLEQPRAASVTMTLDAPTVTELPIWLRKLRAIPAYADATAAVSSGNDAGYQVQLKIHLSPKALVNAKKVTK